MVCFFFVSRTGLTPTCADTNINVGDTIRCSRTKDSALLSFVFFIAIVSGFLFLFCTCMWCVGAQKVFEPIQLDSRARRKRKELLLFYVRRLKISY
jgi:hypothetical protein